MNRGWTEGFMVGCLAGMVAVVAMLLAVPQRPADVVAAQAPAFVEQLAAGETLWDLAREYAPNRDPREWIGRVCELNGWTGVPPLQPAQPFVVVSWRNWPRDITEAEVLGQTPEGR